MRRVSQAEDLLASHEGLRSIELVGLLVDMFVSLVELLVRHPYNIRSGDLEKYAYFARFQVLSAALLKIKTF